MELIIIPATEEYAEAAGALYDKVVYAIAEEENYPRWIPGMYPSLATAEEGIAAGDLYLCFAGEDLVGLFRLNETGTPDFDTASWAKEVPKGGYLVLHALAVDTEKQRQGAGRACVLFCQELAREKGYEGIRLDITADNPPARTLYEDLGFTCADSVIYELPTEEKEKVPFDLLEWYVE